MLKLLTVALSCLLLRCCAAFTKLVETRIIPRTGDPVWNEQHTVAVAHNVSELLLLVKDNDRLSAEHVAEVSNCSQTAVKHAYCVLPAMGFGDVSPKAACSCIRP